MNLCVDKGKNTTIMGVRCPRAELEGLKLNKVVARAKAAGATNEQVKQLCGGTPVSEEGQRSVCGLVCMLEYLNVLVSRARDLGAWAETLDACKGDKTALVQLVRRLEQLQLVGLSEPEQQALRAVKRVKILVGRAEDAGASEDMIAGARTHADSLEAFCELVTRLEATRGLRVIAEELGAGEEKLAEVCNDTAAFCGLITSLEFGCLVPDPVPVPVPVLVPVLVPDPDQLAALRAELVLLDLWALQDYAEEVGVPDERIGVDGETPQSLIEVIVDFILNLNCDPNCDCVPSPIRIRMIDMNAPRVNVAFYGGTGISLEVDFSETVGQLKAKIRAQAEGESSCLLRATSLSPVIFEHLRCPACSPYSADHGTGRRVRI